MTKRPWPDVWPDEDDLEEPSEAPRLIEEASRGIAEELRAAGEPSIWDWIGSVFEELPTRRKKP